MQVKRLIKKTGLYFIGNLSSKILSALLIPIYAFYITTNDLGYYDYTQTIMGVLIPVVFIAIWESILRFVLSESDEARKRTVIATSACFSLVMTGVFVVGFMIYDQVISPGTKSIALIGMMFLSHAFVQIWQYYARALEMSRTYIFAGVAGTIINFVFVVLLICIMRFELNGLFISFILGQVSIFIIIETKVRVLSKIKIHYLNLDVLKKMLFFSAPLVLNLTSIWLVSGFGRFIIINKLGMEANGLFSFASKFSLIITMIGSVVTMAIIEEAIILAKTKGLDSSFAKTIETLFKIFQSIILLAVPAIVIFYTIIYSTDYYISMWYTPWLLIYAVVLTMSSNVGSIFQVINKTKYQFTTTVMGALVTVVISYCFILSIGVYAVIVGQVLGAITMLLTRYMLVNKFIEFKINWKPILGMTGIFIVTALICLNNHFLISFIVFAVVAGFVCYINWFYVKLGYGLVKSRFGNTV